MFAKIKLRQLNSEIIVRICFLFAMTDDYIVVNGVANPTETFMIYIYYSSPVLSLKYH